MRLPVVPAGPWSTAVQPSYQVLPMEDTRQVLGALSRPAVSVVQLRRGGTRGRQLWPQGSEPAPARADTRLSLSAGAAAASEASDDAELVALLDASFAQAPPSVRRHALALALALAPALALALALALAQALVLALALALTLALALALALDPRP